MLIFTILLTAGLGIAKPSTETALQSDDLFAELDNQFTLRFFDAVTGDPIPDASIAFEGRTLSSDNEGLVRFPFPLRLDPEEVRNATFSKQGYVNADIAIEFVVGTVFFNRYSISPSLPAGKLRVVLDWSNSPKDLDAHLTKKDSYHISYRDTQKVEDRAELDRDDRNGHGPETITINKLDGDGHYTYFIHNYSNQSDPTSTNLSKSLAHVRVYSDTGVEHTFLVPEKQAGTIWKVFEIINGAIVPSYDPLFTPR